VSSANRARFCLSYIFRSPAASEEVLLEVKDSCISTFIFPRRFQFFFLSFFSSVAKISVCMFVSVMRTVVMANMEGGPVSNG
jgi:hypothetical protein